MLCNNALQSIEQKIAGLSHTRKRALRIKSDLERSITSLQDHLEDLEQAKQIVLSVASFTHAEMKDRFSSIVSTALEIVFPDPYEFTMDFVIRRGKTEVDLLLARDGASVHPLSAAGGGVVEVVSFALRLAVVVCSVSKLEHIIIMDEAFKFVSKDLQSRIVDLLQELSSRLGFQFILVSHELEFRKMVHVIDLGKSGGSSYVDHD